MALAVAAQWLANLFVSWSFKVVDGNSQLNAMFNHGFAYWIYAAASVVAALFVMRYVPETKGKSLEAIQDIWGKRAANAPAAAAPQTGAWEEHATPRCVEIALARRRRRCPAEARQKTRSPYARAMPPGGGGRRRLVESALGQGLSKVSASPISATARS